MTPRVESRNGKRLNPFTVSASQPHGSSLTSANKLPPWALSKSELFLLLLLKFLTYTQETMRATMSWMAMLQNQVTLECIPKARHERPLGCSPLNSRAQMATLECALTPTALCWKVAWFKSFCCNSLQNNNFSNLELNQREGRLRSRGAQQPPVTTFSQ